MAKGRSVRFADVGDIGEDELLRERPADLPQPQIYPTRSVVPASQYQQEPSANSGNADSDVRVPISPEQVDMIRRVWGDVVCGDGTKVAAILRTRSVVAEETSRVLRSAINIGRSLNELKRALLPEEFDRGMRASREVFPGWSQGNMSKLMNVARFIDERHLPPDSVPQSYTTLYEFTTLDELQFQKAQELQLFRPDVQRSAVQEFKRVVGKSAMIDPSSLRSSAAEEILSIDNRLIELRREIRELRRRRSLLVG